MQLSIDQKDIDKFLMIGDKVLIKPKNPQSQNEDRIVSASLGSTRGEDTSGLYHKDRGPDIHCLLDLRSMRSGRKKKGEEVQYLPLQAREGDLAVYLQNAAYEINLMTRSS